MGLELPPVVPPAGVYVPAVRSGSYVYSSGQVPLVDGELAVTGRVGVDVSLDDAKQAARICALNALAAVASLVDIDQVKQVVKVVGFVNSDPDFSSQAQVINGASELLGAVFGAAGQHARSAIGVAALPLGAPVEVELVVEV
ncbi:MAG: RidA family protein [Streptosporangiales bacterium]|nr:RidA family protein [Streptosporangiales bacterium]MBO0889597.1 RidA family protein [Acidothermales bacterium]